MKFRSYVERELSVDLIILANSVGISVFSVVRIGDAIVLFWVKFVIFCRYLEGERICRHYAKFLAPIVCIATIAVLEWVCEILPSRHRHGIEIRCTAKVDITQINVVIHDAAKHVQREVCIWSNYIGL